MILFYHTHTKKIFTFPKKKLNDQLAWNHSLIEAWARMVMFEADGPYMEKFIREYSEEQTKGMPEVEKAAFMQAMENDIQMTYEGAKAAKREYERIENMLEENKQRLINEMSNKTKSEDDDEDFMDEIEYQQVEL